MIFHPLYPPQSYSPAAGVHPTPVGLPTQLTSFSYSPRRELLLDERRRDEALQHYRAPGMGADLNWGFEGCEWGEERMDEGLDALLLRSVVNSEWNRLTHEVRFQPQHRAIADSFASS